MLLLRFVGGGGGYSFNFMLQRYSVVAILRRRRFYLFVSQGTVFCYATEGIVLLKY